MPSMYPGVTIGHVCHAERSGEFRLVDLVVAANQDNILADMMSL